MGDLNILYTILAIKFLLVAGDRDGIQSSGLKLVQDWPNYNNFGQIAGVSVDSKGNVFVFHRVDRVWDGSSFSPDNMFLKQNEGPIRNDTLIVLNPVDGRLIKRTGSELFYMPHGLTLDHEDNIWVTDVAMHQVFKFPPLDLNSENSNLKKPLLILGEKFQPAKDDDHFCKPTDVAIDKSTGDFFVSDGYCNSRIMKFNKQGKKILEWGAKLGSRKFTLQVPHALALDDENKMLFVADREDFRFVAFNSTTGDFVKAFAENLGNRVFSIAYSPKQGGLIYAVTVPGIPPRRSLPAIGIVYRVENGEYVAGFFPQVKVNFFQSPHDVAVSKDGKWCYVVELDKHIWKFNAEVNITDRDDKTVGNNIKNEISATEHQLPIKGNESISGTYLAISLVISIVVVALLIFMYHIYKRKGQYRRSEMRGLILDDEEDSLNLN